MQVIQERVRKEDNLECKVAALGGQNMPINLRVN